MGTTVILLTESEPQLAGTEQVKHTPGPWEVWRGQTAPTGPFHRNASVWAPNAEHIVAYTDFLTSEIAAANAQIIAAAPTMLAALKAAQEALFWHKAEQFEFENDGVKVGDQVAAAIAKAEGRTP